MRVGFLFRGSDAWLGGVNYLWNLFYAVGQHERDSLTPVLIAARGSDLFGLAELPGVDLVWAPFPEESRSEILRRTLERRLGGSDRFVAEICRGARVDAVSHSGTYGWRFPLPTLPWLADLQHRRMPHFFSPVERALRAYSDASQLLEGNATIVSSAAAERDSRLFYGPLARRVEVLRFVSQPRLAREAIPTREALRRQYALPPRYFFLPNQFWRHKNHLVVLEALELLQRRGVQLNVVLTGRGEDYRVPDHYPSLMARVGRGGLTAQFRHLGLVSYGDLMGLMRASVAVINPSYFEGWSTTVEEARSLGKASILSDIDVHREQDPPGATYFPPADARSLAATLEEAWSRDHRDEDAERLRAAEGALTPRTAFFAARYRRIVTDAIERGGSSPALP